MTHIPDPIATRWRPMWHPDAHPERPWWRAKEIGVTVRVDGLLLVMYDAMGLYPNAMHLPHDEDVDEALARIDAEHPLPAPLPMPGQVWAFGAFTERTVADVVAGVAWLSSQPGTPEEGGPGIVVCPHPEMMGATTWPPVNGVLVAGPTPWGRDVPWSP